ncbi:DUF5069 domain-containing protein [Rubellicoccus peritrichatus]|uniref:DUF5069 domain-containing protein n=1 Tax=Rubellicoccus peritrichatus TaxID=3080537 RepID=A0AAQ3LHS0_9BACT|nr:DUF5069 domain-containing protein [Puniceicoccus sp. CR14]WOO42304.1 DUF5069 domain-containing protein [Puniceicoccus sp. CR14]
MSTQTIQSLDLTKETPRSPRATLGGYVVAGRTLDKCRAAVAGTLGEYHFNCPLDQIFLSFAGVSAEGFQEFVATGADDDAVAKWIQENSSNTQEEIVKWNNDLRYKRINEMPVEIQVFLEGYIAEFIPQDRVIYHWFDVYDIEEGRI